MAGDFTKKLDGRTEGKEARAWQIGKAHRKIDAADRMRGQLRYADDLKMPGMLHCKIVRSPHPHAKILGIDTDAVMQMDGVHGVVTGKDFPTPYGVIPWTPDENALAVDKALHVGDGVAAIAAISEDVANAAVRALKIDYELLPAYFDPEEALAGEQINPYSRKGNLSKKVELEFGEVEKELESAHLVVEDRYFFEGSTHGAIEPHCAVANVEPNGVLTVWSATQVSHYLHRELAKVLDMPANRIRVIQPPLGGAFGGKSEPFDLEFCVAKLALQTGRPVKCLYTREEVFYSHRGRHPMRMDYRTGFDKDGKIVSVDAKTLIDGGAYSSFGLVTTYYSGQLLCAPYDFGAYRFNSKRVTTNKPACGPKRGHGSVQPRFAIECQLDKGAVALGIDPIELRRRNFIGGETQTINEFKIGSNGFMECLDKVEASSNWKERYGKMAFGKGLGVAGSTYISGTNYCIYPNEMPQAAVQISLDRSGRARIFSGANDIGQGSSTMLAVIASEELGLELADIRVVAADSDLCPVDLGAYSSRITLMVGNACVEAAKKLRKVIVKHVAASWEVPEKQINLVGGMAVDMDDPERSISLAEAFVIAETEEGMLSAVGNYGTRSDRHGEYRGGTIGASPAYSFTAHVAEVEVDEETGVVEVTNVWVAHDCGRALSPMIVEGQMEGSVYMGFGEAIMEEHTINSEKNGVHNAPSLLDYRMPTFLDTPHIESLIVEAADAQGPYGAKEAGEGPLHPIIPAISNAIYDAIGIRLNKTPFSPPAVLAALAERKEREARGEIPPHKSTSAGGQN